MGQQTTSKQASGSKKMDDEGFEPSTFSMQSRRSTTDLTAQVIVGTTIDNVFISRLSLNRKNEKGGHCGLRSHYLTHAKRALYQLS